MATEIPSNYGYVREFNSQTTDWVIYKRRLENNYQVNGIKEESKKRAILLNALDEDAYKLIYNLCLPTMPENKNYVEITGLFDKYFKSPESVFVSRSKFFEARI